MHREVLLARLNTAWCGAPHRVALVAPSGASSVVWTYQDLSEQVPMLSPYCFRMTLEGIWHTLHLAEGEWVILPCLSGALMTNTRILSRAGRCKPV